MSISVFDLFKIGIGPSSSHTVGPMKAAHMFVNFLEQEGLLDSCARIKVDLLGSLGATGRGHGSVKAVLLGLMGQLPETVDLEQVEQIIGQVRQEEKLSLLGVKNIAFNEKNDLVLHKRKSLPYHPNGMTIEAFASDGSSIVKKAYYSIGGGFVLDDKQAEAAKSGSVIVKEEVELPLPFCSGKELLAICKEKSLKISEVMMQNELVWRSEDEIRNKLLEIWRVMRECVENGCRNSGVLPGGLNVQRRARSAHQRILQRNSVDPLAVVDWVNLYALAVNEENAAGGRVVTAPTNGAAGIVPAVLHYYYFFIEKNDDKVVDFLLTAGAIGSLFKRNASISGAEVGCQGEVGSACAMAAGGLAEISGATVMQAENAAEIAMEHNLGLTCDPIGGLVQIPCIERNAVAANKAINAVRIAMLGDGEHFVSLDKVIETMRQTGLDMAHKYKETARGGLATNVLEVPVTIVDC